MLDNCAFWLDLKNENLLYVCDDDDDVIVI